MKDKLQNEVTKTKEKLENYLSLISNEIRINKKINKGINKLKNEKNWENNTYKILSYISEINTNRKKLYNLLKIHMKNLKLSFKEEENNIIYEEYYFNGINIPKNLEFKNITYNSLNLSWEIDHINNININKDKIKYKVEMRKNNEPFIKVYEGQNLYCNIDNLDFNTNYEFKVCSIYNDIIGEWSEIKKIKTKNFDFDIIFKKQKNYKIQSGEIDEGLYNTNLWKSSGDRSVLRHIYFNEKYETTPQVLVSLSGLDICNEKNARVKVYAENIDINGFDIKIFTWGDSSLWRIKVSWISFG